MYLSFTIVLFCFISRLQCALLLSVPFMSSLSSLRSFRAVLFANHSLLPMFLIFRMFPNYPVTRQKFTLKSHILCEVKLSFLWQLPYWITDMQAQPKKLDQKFSLWKWKEIMYGMLRKTLSVSRTLLPWKVTPFRSQSQNLDLLIIKWLLNQLQLLYNIHN